MAIDPSKPFDLTHVVDEDQHGMRLDRYVCHQTPTISRTRVQQYMRAERVLVNDQVRPQNWRVKTGDRVVLKCTVPEGGAEIAREIPLEVIYEDQHLVAFNKQSGLVVHPVALHRHNTLLNAVYYRYEKELGPDQEISLANRIDKMTSGVILVTKDVPTKRHLQEQFEARTVAKSYLAIVYGRVTPEEQVVDLPIGPARNRRNRTLMGIRE
ncbi:MAG: pseudouridine synthase, partial [Planctomycetota bacterium]